MTDNIPAQLALLFILLFAAAGGVLAQSGRSIIRGKVLLNPGAVAAQRAMITIVETNRSVLTDDEGKFELSDISPGEYHLIAHLDRVPVIKTIKITEGVSVVDFELTLTCL